MVFWVTSLHHVIAAVAYYGKPLIVPARKKPTPRRGFVAPPDTFLREGAGLGGERRCSHDSTPCIFRPAFSCWSLTKGLAHYQRHEIALPEMVSPTSFPSNLRVLIARLLPRKPRGSVQPSRHPPLDTPHEPHHKRLSARGRFHWGGHSNIQKTLRLLIGRFFRATLVFMFSFSSSTIKGIRIGIKISLGTYVL